MMCGCIKECFLNHLEFENFSNYKSVMYLKLIVDPVTKRLIKDFESTFSFSKHFGY